MTITDYSLLFNEEHKRHQRIQQAIDNLPSILPTAAKMDFIDNILHNPYIPHIPTPKQTWALITKIPELLFGGAAGGGKSDFLLMRGLRYVDRPQCRSLLLRRTFPQLSMADALIPRSHEWLQGTDALWNEGKKRWTFPTGSILQFSHLDYEKDKYNFQGSAWHFIGFDELTQFTQSQFEYLHSRNRKLIEDDIPLLVAGASNPGGIGHEWVKERFVVSEEPDVLFIPSRIEDNPHLNQEEYRTSLMRIKDPITQRQLLHGDWDVRVKGGLFDRSKIRMIDYLPDGLDKTVRFWDMAASEPKPGTDPDWTVGVKMGVKGGDYYILDVIRVQQDPGGTELTLRNAAINDGVYVAARYEQEPGASGKTVTKHYSRTVFKGFDFQGIRSTGSKVNRARPVSAAWANGNVYMLNAPWNGTFLHEVEAFPQPDGSVHDDQVDGMSGAFNNLSGGGAWGFL